MNETNKIVELKKEVKFDGGSETYGKDCADMTFKIEFECENCGSGTGDREHALISIVKKHVCYEEVAGLADALKTIHDCFAKLKHNEDCRGAEDDPAFAFANGGR